MEEQSFMKDHYPSEKFNAAVRALATGLDPLQKRLGAAFNSGLYPLLEHLDKLPESAREKLERYQAASNMVDDPGKEGTINVWANGLSDEEAKEIALWIVETAFELEADFWSANA